MLNLKRADADIRADVISELESDPVTPIVKILNLKVTVKDGKVTLQGEADSFGSKMEAEELAFLVPGVKEIDNKLTIAPSEGKMLPDVELLREVRALLALDMSLPGDSITVSVCNGLITLGGLVEWNYQSEEAEKVAAGVRGVKEVQNYITVRQPFVCGSDIEVRIAEAFARRHLLLETNVMVGVEGSEVTLLGTVKTRAESNLARALAKNTPGVTRVTDNLIVTSEQA